MIQIQDLSRYLYRLIPVVSPKECAIGEPLIDSDTNGADVVVVRIHPNKVRRLSYMAEVCLRKRPTDLGGSSFELSVDPLNAPHFTHRKWIIDEAELSRAMVTASVTLRDRKGRALVPDLRLLLRRLRAAHGRTK